MITLTAFIVFSGFYACYYTSAKAVLTGNSGLETAIKNNPATAKSVGLVLVLTGLTVSILCNGIGVGTLQFFILLMVSGSTIVLLSPLRIVNLPSVVIVFAFAMLIEIFNLI